MRFYTKQHQYYCGIDLHARRMYVCVVDREGKILVHRNGPATAEHLLKTIARFRPDVVIGVECMFTLPDVNYFSPPVLPHCGLLPDAS